MYFFVDTLELASMFCLKFDFAPETEVKLTSREDMKNIALLCLCMVQ